MQITRKCEHCIQGEAQNVSMTKEVIDRVFEDITNVGGVFISGGEPLLEIELIRYISNKLIKIGIDRSICIPAKILFSLITNGEILDERIIDILENFCKSTGLNAKLAISSDEFHDKAATKKALEFYSYYANLANQRLCESDGAVIVERHIEELTPITYKS